MDLTGLSFDDVLLRPKRGVLNSRKEADISVPSLGLRIPLIAAPMPSVASRQLLLTIALEGGMGVVHRMNRTEEEMIEDFDSSLSGLAVAIGLDTDVEKLHHAGVEIVVIDVAHAHSDSVIDFIEEIREQYPSILIIAGNVATADATADLINAGANAIKVGIGPGSVCITRQVTGFGVPQLQAIQECAEVAYDWETDKKIPIIADGGIRNSGDIVKAIAAGADAVMIGSLFARSYEAGSTHHYGNASARVRPYNAPEGIEVEIYDKEPLSAIIKRLCWGIKSGISYAGGTKLEDLRHCEFIPLANGAREESKL